MLPKKNIGAITVMSAFLGLAASRLCTALLYRSGCRADADLAHITDLLGIVGIVEMLLIIALAVGFGLIFLYSEDNYSTALLGSSALLAVLCVSSKIPFVSSAAPVISAIGIAMNICLLAIFGIYAMYYYKRDMKTLAAVTAAAGLWVAVLSVLIRPFAAASESQARIFGVFALISFISAVCYGIAFYSQRQSFE